MLPTQSNNELTMSSSQFAEILGYTKKQINLKIKEMFPEEIDGKKILPSRDSRGYVDEYHLPEIEAQMFAARWNKNHLRKVCEYFTNKRPVVPDFSNAAEAARAWADAYEEKQIAQQQLAIAAPKAEAYDELNSGAYSTFRKADSDLGLVQGALQRVAIDWGWLSQNKTRESGNSYPMHMCRTDAIQEGYVIHAPHTWQKGIHYVTEAKFPYLTLHGFESMRKYIENMDIEGDEYFCYRDFK